MKGRILYLIGIVFLIPSCASRNKKIMNGDPVQRSPFEYDERYCLEQGLISKLPFDAHKAMIDPQLIDIPMPFDTIPIAPSQETSAQGDHYKYYMYSSSLDRASLASFFNEQMEAFGWQQEVMIHSFEDMLVFDKAHKKIFMSLRSPSGPKKKGKTIIVLFVLNKLHSERVEL